MGGDDRRRHAYGRPELIWGRLTKRLEGRRVGDRFIAACGKVVHADVNAARNVRDRIDDPEITRFIPYREVKAILLRRSSGGALPVKRPD